MIKKSAKLLVGVFIVLIIIAVLGHSVIIPKLIPLSDLPTPSGVYSVGTKIFEWTDESRDEWFTEDKDDKRLGTQAKIQIQLQFHTWCQQISGYQL